MALPRSLCVFCGSSDRAAKSHRVAAARFGRELGRKGIELVFGGGRVGLMGVIADSALTAGGRVVGVIPEHLIRAEVGHGKVSELIVTASMHERKAAMFQRADAFVVLPGGPGTLDETFEILTWRQLALHDKPVVICDLEGYWTPLTDLIDHMIRRRYVRPSFRDFYAVVERTQDVLPRLESMPAARRPTRADRV
ncbi:MAG: TIGR00730 family Rossman fold protein [Alphaproteobacteria bacterium]|nr:TIGR00730 family Rossman fold protein [Alphaproteobacteria bacterium]